MNVYEQKFRELIQYLAYKPNEARKCRMFEKGLNDDISTSVVASMFSTYAKCVESARSVEMMVSKRKALEAPRDVVVVEVATKEAKHSWKDDSNAYH